MAGLLLLLGTSVQADGFDPRFSNTVSQLSAYITNQMAANGVAGLSLALVESNAIVWSQGFGKAVLENNVDATAQTVYRIGSVSKLFTTLAVLKLWEGGLVDLAAPLTTYIPEFTMLQRYGAIRPPTLQECLNHLSGLPGDMFRDTFSMAPWDGYNAWLLAELATDYPNYPPAFRSIYCNSGFQMAEEVVARVSGMPLNDFAQSNFFGPLGMTSSSYLKDKPNIVARRAHSYASGVPLPEEFVNSRSTGGMYSSVEDMAAFIRLILAQGSFNGTNILATNTVAVMQTDQTTNIAMNWNSGLSFGLGWDQLADVALGYAGRVFVKGGETFTCEAALDILPDRQLGVVVLQNTTGTLPGSVAREALKQAVWERDGLHQPTNFVPSVTAVQLWSSSVLNTVTGLYVSAEGMDSGYDIITATPGGSLTWILKAQTDSPTVVTGLVPHADGWFYRPDQAGVRIQPTNLAGRAVLLFREAEEYGESHQFRGDLYVPPPLSAAWSNRMNTTWLPVDFPSTDIYWAYAAHGLDVRLHLTNRVGMIWLSSPSGKFVISPSNDNLGFAAGSAVRRGASAVITTNNGSEQLRFASYTYGRVDALPALTVGSATNGTLGMGVIQWFAVNAVTGAYYRAAISNNTGAVLLNFMSKTQTGQWTTNGLGWTCPTNGQYWLGLLATTSTPFTLSLAADNIQSSLVTVQAKPAIGGTVSGGGIFQISSNVNLSATPMAGWLFAGWNDGNTNATRTITVPASNSTYSANFVMGLGAALHATNLEWTTGGDANWTVETTTTRDGVAAVQSGVITGGQRSWIQATTNGPGSILFWWKVSSETGDAMQFTVNGQFQSQITTSVDWQPFVVFLGSTNTYTLRWTFAKNAYTSAGGNAGWVDQVTWLPCPYAAQAPQLFFTEPNGLLASWVLETNSTYKFSRLLANIGVWQPKAMGDVDGDGTGDLIFQNGAGDTAIWFVNADGSTRSSRYLGNTGEWEVRACADYLAAGRANIFFQTPAGAVAYWQTDTNGVCTNSVFLGLTGAWQLKAAADLDNDHQAEVLWQLPGGLVAAWFHTNLAIRAQLLGTTGVWELCGALPSSLTNQGTLVWQAPTGRTAGWLVDTNGVPVSTLFYGDTAPWQLKAAGR
jgi:CubicO group peptidase (beta-lactamase class C family)